MILPDYVYEMSEYSRREWIKRYQLEASRRSQMNRDEAIAESAKKGYGDTPEDAAKAIATGKIVLKKDDYEGFPVGFQNLIIKAGNDALLEVK